MNAQAFGKNKWLNRQDYKKPDMVKDVILSITFYKRVNVSIQIEQRSFI